MSLNFAKKIRKKSISSAASPTNRLLRLRLRKWAFADSKLRFLSTSASHPLFVDDVYWWRPMRVWSQHKLSETQFGYIVAAWRWRHMNESSYR